MSDPTTWNTGDFHRWVRPPSKPCPDCECCSEALCRKAIDESTACHLVGSSADFDLSACPCWRTGGAQ